MPRQNVELDREDCAKIAEYLYKLASEYSKKEDKENSTRCEELATIFDESGSGNLYRWGE